MALEQQEQQDREMDVATGVFGLPVSLTICSMAAT